MKTPQEVYDAILGSDELKKEIAEAIKNGKLDEFLKAQGCESGQADFEVFMKEKAAQLSEEELKQVAGGMELTNIDNPLSTMMPWICNPNYSSTIDKDGKVNPILICA